MIKIIKIAFETGLINPLRFIQFIYYLIQTGPNLLLLLRYSKSRYPKTICIRDAIGSITYENLYVESNQLAIYLEENYTKKGRNKIGLVVRNSTDNVKILFALSRTGADVFLLNADLNPNQLSGLIKKLNLDLVLLDSTIIDSEFNLEEGLCISVDQLMKDFDGFSKQMKRWKRIPPRKSGALVVLTGGTTGNSKEAKRKPGLFTFLNPLYALLKIVKINQYKTVYVPLPVYHGFGLAAVITSVFIGKTIFLSKKFKAVEAVDLIKKNEIDVITLVPVMLQRIMDFPEGLKNVKCIISGGAPISSSLVISMNELLEGKLYNLYGTSETGFCILATPADLINEPKTIGKPIYGVKVKLDTTKVINRDNCGEIIIRNNWTTSKKSWIRTGDVGYRNENGYFFLHGRIDDMIVSGGENVFPEDLEKILQKHPAVKEAAVIGIMDEEFGQRLKAFIVLKENSVDADKLLFWVKKHAAKFQIPQSITIIEEMPYTSVGKINKKELKSKI